MALMVIVDPVVEAPPAELLQALPPDIAASVRQHYGVAQMAERAIEVYSSLQPSSAR